jgi:integrase/recombinase XerD
MPDPKGPRRRKAPPNTFWHANGTLWGRKQINGQLRRWTLRTSDVEVAKQRVEEDIARLTAAAFYSDNRVRYEDIVAAWAERHITHEVGPLTARRYAVSLRQLEPMLLGKFLDEVDKAAITQIVEVRRAAGVSTATIRRDLTALASVLAYADVDSNPALERLHRLKERRDPIVLPDEAHIRRIIARAPGRIPALVETAWRTGCRLEELVTAERTRLDHARRQLTVRGKGNKVRVVDLDFGGAYELLRSLPVRLGCRWLFWHGAGEPYRNLSSRFAHLVRGELALAIKQAKAAGHDEPDFRAFRFHDLRHRHAVDWLRAGRSIYDLQQRLGHASIKTTEIYLRFLTAEEARAVKFGDRQAEAGEQRGA